ncbi:MAG: YciI family protein [Caldilineaceae bacterium]|nr:YciI family protein [Caldilineaceae bacterium]
MKYMFLIYGEESSFAQSPSAEWDAMMGEYMAFTEEARAQGVYVDGDELKPTTTATTVHPQGSPRPTTDGPYAETKEQLGGYYILACQTLDEALAWAAKIPGARTGSVEVRPIVNFG